MSKSLTTPSFGEYSMHDTFAMNMGNSSHSMPMFFVNTIMLHNFLFEGVMVHKWWQYLITLIIVFIACIVNQFLSWIAKRKVTYSKPSQEYESLNGSSKNVTGRNMYYAWFVIKPTIYLFQNALSYLLMLAVMSYNTGLFLTIVAGNTIGWAIFSMRDNVEMDCCG